jgi:hypothetical protein
MYAGERLLVRVIVRLIQVSLESLVARAGPWSARSKQSGELSLYENEYPRFEVPNN